MNRIYLIFLIPLFFLSSCRLEKRLILNLEMIRAVDPRLPMFSENDLQETLEEARRVIAIKLGDNLDIRFKDNGVVTLEEFFSTNYNLSESENEYQRKERFWKYDLVLGDKNPMLETTVFKEQLEFFLSRYSLKSLRGFFPGRIIQTRKDAGRELMRVYHAKIKSLKLLKTQTGETLLLIPGVPYQSYAEWGILMKTQDRYDLVITNTLVVMDTLGWPSVHSIALHGKVAGAAFRSPRRKPLMGQSMMINILDEYGQIKGISEPDKTITNSQRNKMLGGFVLAHEFGHTFYMIPDVYDHSDYCLMNSSLEYVNHYRGYEKLMVAQHRCLHCLPWILSRNGVLRADRAFREGRYKSAAELYMLSARKIPRKILRDRKKYRRELLWRALEAYEKARDFDGIYRVHLLLRK